MFAPALLALTVMFPLLPQDPPKPQAPAAAPAPKAPIERKGTFVPADPIEVQLWLDAYKDELLVLDAVPHGFPVNQGDALVGLDTAKIDEQIALAEFALQQTKDRLRLTEKDRDLQAAAAAAELQRLQQDADWSARRLKGYLEQESAHRQEQERMSEQYEQNQIDDQTDELTQLEKMYKEDELVDATEEIVLKRSRRSLAQTRARIALQQLIRKYTHEVAWAIEKEGRQAEVAQKQSALERQQQALQLKAATQKLDAQKQQVELEKQQDALAKLRHDREAMVVRAPKDGIVLHGDPRAVPGSGKLEKGAVLPQRKTFLCITEPGRFEVLTDLLEDDVAKVKLGAAVEVLPTGRDDIKLLGTARVSDMPSGRDGEGRNLYEVRVALAKPDQRLRAGMRCKVLIRQDGDAK